MKRITKKRKLEILDQFLAEVRRISANQINVGCDAGDPLAQVRAACNVLEQAFAAQQCTKNLRSPTPGTYRITSAGAREYIVQPTFVAGWRGARGENAPQYSVSRSANNYIIAWCYALEEAQYACRLLNGSDPTPTQPQSPGQ